MSVHPWYVPGTLLSIFPIRRLRRERGTLMFPGRLVHSSSIFLPYSHWHYAVDALPLVLSHHDKRGGRNSRTNTHPQGTTGHHGSSSTRILLPEKRA